MQKQQDNQLLAAFHLMNPEERDFFLDIALTQTEGRSGRPVLRLVPSQSSLLPGGALGRSLG